MMLNGLSGLTGVTLPSALAWDRTEAALARIKALNHYPVVAAYEYFLQVWCALCRLLHNVHNIKLF